MSDPFDFSVYNAYKQAERDKKKNVANQEQRRLSITSNVVFVGGGNIPEPGGGSQPSGSVQGELEDLIQPVSTGIETKTGVSKGSTLDMSSLSYDRIWVHIIKGSTGYTSATILLQVCDNDSAVDAEWETLGTFTLVPNETDSINKKWSANFARLNITAFVGTDIKMNLGATV